MHPQTQTLPKPQVVKKCGHSSNTSAKNLPIYASSLKNAEMPKKCPHKNSKISNLGSVGANDSVNTSVFKKCGHINKNFVTNNNVVQNNCPLHSRNVQSLNNSGNIKAPGVAQNVFSAPVQTPKNTAKPQVQNQGQKLNQTPVKQQVVNKKRSKNVPPEGANNKPEDDEIREIFKRDNSICNSSDKNNFAATNNENLTFQKVTQELANIIKDFQKQIHDVPISTAKMEEVPSAMIQPKNKEFFKNLTPQTPPTKAPPNKNQTLDKKQVESKNSQVLAKRNSLRSFSRTSFGSSHRRISCSTYQGLNIRKSFSNRTMNRSRSSSSSVDPLKVLREEVQRAIRERKTFTVRGQYNSIRKALVARGWVEKFHISYKDQLDENLKKYQSYTIAELLPLMRREELTTTCKNLIKSKLLGGYQVDFYWGISDEAFRENPDKIKLTMINKLKREIFSYTNKQGLCDASKVSYWFQKNNVSKLNHPRSYSLHKNGDLKSFIDDFNITAAMSLLKWVVKTDSTKESKLISPTGKIPLEAFDFALNECCKFIKRGRHEDIDIKIQDAKENEWTQFLDYFYKLVHYSNHFKDEGQETEDSLVRKSNYVLNNLKSFYPFVDMDGMMNIWILKPTASSRGRGIHMCRTLEYVLKVVKQHANVRYIIQKYIERPLLIYNTKFDIRQWFLISNCNPLTIWIYKECYLRFSSQTYNLRKLHESIHLTNNSVQKKYKNTSLDTALPSYNMWDSNDFQRYLTNIGYPNAFKDIVYPGMKQCLTAAVMMHQDKMVVRKNCFELYGADFILTEDFQPWLLEINSNPALGASTPVTARMCPRVLEDVIKVVIDFAHNCKANTGGFELLYREKVNKLPTNPNLELRGLPLQKDYFFNPSQQEVGRSEGLKEKVVGTKCNSLVVDKTQENLKMFGEEIKKTLRNLLQIIHNEKEKRCFKKSQNLGGNKVPNSVS